MQRLFSIVSVYATFHVGYVTFFLSVTDSNLYIRIETKRNQTFPPLIQVYSDKLKPRWKGEIVLHTDGRAMYRAEKPTKGFVPAYQHTYVCHDKNIFWAFDIPKQPHIGSQVFPFHWASETEWTIFI